MRLLSISILTLALLNARAQCPSDLFSLGNSACLSEPVSPDNEASFSRYTWDICSGSLLGDGEGSVEATLSELGVSFGSTVEVVEDTVFLFVLENEGLLTRLVYPNGLSGSMIEDDLGSISGQLGTSYNLSFYQDYKEDWYGFIGSDGLVYQLYFGKSLRNIPSIKEIEVSGALDIRDIEVIEDSDSVRLVMVGGGSSNGELTIYSIPSNDLNGAGVQRDYSIAGGNFLLGIDMVKECDEWKALVVGGGSGLHRVDFSMGFLTQPSEEGISTSLTRLRDLVLVWELDSLYAFLTSDDTGDNLYRLGFGEGLFSGAPTIETLGNYGAFNDARGLNLFFDGGEYHLTAVNSLGATLGKIDFDRSCDAELLSDSIPEFSYSTSGVYNVSLTAVDDSGSQSRQTRQINITSSTAPTISFDHSQSICVSTPTQFTPSNPTEDITTYSWDFNADGIEDSSDPNPTYQFPSAGTYSVRLDVLSDAGCGNYVEEEITIYPEPPIPTFSTSATTYCIGSEISFSNETDDSAYDGLVEYHWSLTDLSDTTTTGDLSVTFETSGQKIISVYSSIPGCESAMVYDTITIEASPNIDFSTTPVCHGDLTTFTNGSDTGDYLWDFGDGFTSTTRDPDHLYSEPGTYNVTLTVTNANGCFATQQKQVVVSALPDPGFEYTLLCEGDSTVLQDISIVDNSNVVAWEWFVADELVSQQQSPEVTFSSEGTQTVRLVVYADNGCEASYSESVQVLAMPNADFSVSLGCEGEESIFTDATTNPDQIAARTWMVDGEIVNSTEETLSYAFSEAGSHEVTLIVDNQNLCSGTYSQTVEIPEPPSLSFTVEGSCNNDDITVRDLSITSNDQILSRRWFLNGQQVGNGAQVLLPVVDSGQQEVTLEVETAFGCIYQARQSFESYGPPQVSFEASNDYGVPPFAISFTNNTQNGSTYRWFIDDVEVSSAAEPTLSFTEVGEKEVKLVSENTNGCLDSVAMTISSVLPEIDVSLNKLQLVNNSGVQQILMNVSNQSNLPIEQMLAKITLDNDLIISESITKRINVGQETVISLNLGLPVQQSNVQYLCVSLSTTYSVSDVNQANNENCINIEPDLIIEPPYPNPAREKTSLRAVLPEESDVKLTVIDISGQVRFKKIFKQQPAGLNTFTYDLLKLDAGTYFIEIQYQGRSHRSRIIKQ